MAYEDLQDDINELQENGKKYLSSAGNYYKLLGFKIVTRSITLIAKFSVLAFCGIMFLFFVSLAGAIYLAEIFDSLMYGFLSIAGVYLVAAILLFVIKTSIIEGGVLRKFSDIFFNE